MIGLISDVHGNFPALRAVLAELDRLGCWAIVSLGDVAGYYCQVDRCVEELERRGVVNVMGNHDHCLVSGEPCRRSRSANLCLAYQRRVVTAAHRAWLARSKPFVNLGGIAMVHGGWRDPLDEYLHDVDAMYFERMAGLFFASGHTHVSLLRRFGDKTYFNPGSVGQPRDGDPRAAFAVFHDGTVELRRVAYDIDETARAMRDAGFGDHFYGNLYQGRPIGAPRPAV